jgi:transposase
MDTIIAAPASCEARAVIRFLHTEGKSAVQIHRRLCRVYGDNVMSDSCVREWCRKFRDGGIDVHDEGGQEQHSIVTDVIVQKVDQCLRGKCRFTISELFEDFPRTSRTDFFVSNCHGQIGLPYVLCTMGTKAND